jgi:hypothetical protein
LALEGDLLLDEKELEFDQANFKLRDLAAWAEWKSWEDTFEGDEPHFPRFDHLGARTQSILCDGGTLTIADAGSWKADKDDWHLTSGCRFELELAAALPMDELQYRWLWPLQLLITTATGRPAPQRDLFVTNTSWVVKSADGDRERFRSRWLRVRFQAAAREVADLSVLACRHRMSDFDLDRQIPAFFPSAEHHRYALERYADAKSERLPGYETGFLNAVQAVESLDAGLHTDLPEPWQEAAAEVVDSALKDAGMNSARRRAARQGVRSAHGPSLSRRLRRTDAETGGVVSELAGKGWAEDVEVLRNAITHGRTGDVLRTTSGALIVATHICELLFDLRWHMVLGFEVETAREIVKRRVHQWADSRLIKDHIDVLKATGTMLRAERQKEVEP